MSNTTAIIPCYNDGKYVKESVDSLLNQSIALEKIIIVDDGSDASTRDVLKSLSHPILKVVYQENQGVCAARNNGISMVSTPYVLTLDADDIFESTFLEKALVAIKSEKQIVAVCCYYRKYKNNKPTEDVIKPFGGTAVNFLVKNNGHASALFKRSRWEEIGGYDSQFVKGYEDWDFWISMLMSNNKMFIIPEVLWRYRIKDVSRDQTAFIKYDFSLRKQIFEKHKEFYLRNSSKVIENFIYDNSILKKSLIKTKSSLEYKIGFNLLQPFRFIRNLIFK